MDKPLTAQGRDQSELSGDTSLAAQVSSTVRSNLIQILRDPFLLMMLGIIVAMVTSLRWFIPFFTEKLAFHFDFDAVPYFLLLQSIMPTLISIILGSVMGFLMLDQKDDRTLTAIAVTPLSMSGYVSSIMLFPLLIYLIVTLLSVPVMGIVSMQPGVLLLHVLSGLPLTVIIALTLAVFAENKIQGLALSKFIGILMWIPVIAWFIDEPWQWLFSAAPSFWIAKLTWVIADGVTIDSLLILSGALAVQIAVLVWLFRRLQSTR